MHLRGGPGVSLVVFANGMLLAGLSLVMMLLGLIFPDTREAFLAAGALGGTVGGLTVLAVAHQLGEFRPLHGFVLTSSIWITGAAAGALPLWLWSMGPTDAFFEAMSGITTTGSTVMTDLDQKPPAVLLWRGLLQWFGGIGFIVAGIALLPAMRVGGMQLFRTESSELGDKEMATAARFAGTTLWIYIGLTALCMLVYRVGGMTDFEALVHALTTLSTGGYSTSDDSFGQFDSAVLQWAGTVFMLAGALPFAWYMRWIGRGRFQSEQVRALLTLFAVTIGVLTLWRVVLGGAPVEEALRQVAFSVVSVVTTTGFATVDYTEWGPFAAAAFLALTALGGCTGSTAGGAKTMRWMIFLRVLAVRLKTIRWPHAVIVARYEGRAIPEDVVNGVMTFFVLYGITVIVLAAVLDLYVVDLSTALSGAMTAVANVGPGIGDTIGPSGTFQPLPDGAKWVLCFGMYVGRLEMVTVYVLLTRVFWREVV